MDSLMENLCDINRYVCSGRQELVSGLVISGFFLYNRIMKKQYFLPVLLAITLLAACGGSGGGGSSPGGTTVDINTMAESDIAVDGKFTHTFSEAVSTDTVSDSTFFITSLSAGGEIPVVSETSLSQKATYDPTICMSEN